MVVNRVTLHKVRSYISPQTFSVHGTTLQLAITHIQVCELGPLASKQEANIRYISAVKG